MTQRYLPFLLSSWLGLLSAAAQTPTTLPSADTLRPRPPFRGEQPDSLAALPTPGGTFRLQGQEQPVRLFLTILDQLRTVAGVQVTPYDGSPGSGSVVRIRGASVALTQAQPLYVVDGLPALGDELTPDQLLGSLPPLTPNDAYNRSYSVADSHAQAGGNPLLLLPPESIASVEVLGGPAAVARYGPLGANGVISIRTRRAPAGQPLRARYSAYAGVQQVRQRYSLLGASEYAEVVNEAYLHLNNHPGSLPYPSTQLGTGTDWQAETYRLAGLQQHQLSLEGSHAGTAFRVSADYRQQSGVLRNSDLSHYGLHVGLDQRVGSRLALRGTLALGQTDQTLPYTTGPNGATQAALAAPPTEPVRTALNEYSGYTTTANRFASPLFTNPVASLLYSYRTPRTQRLLSQLAADYQPAPHLMVQASVNFERTLLTAQGYAPPYDYSYPPQPPGSSQQYGLQTLHTSQWAGRLAMQYERLLGTRHHLGVEVDYQYQAQDFSTRNAYDFLLKNPPTNGLPTGVHGYYEYGAQLRLHRPWARLHYALDSTLTVEASLSYARYKANPRTEYYPSAQLSWQPRPTSFPLAPTLWVSAARTGILGYGFGFFGPRQLTSPLPASYNGPYTTRLQSPLRTDQLEAGLRLGRPTAHLSGQLVAYQRVSSHVLLATTGLVPTSSGTTTISLLDEGTIRNQGLELTLQATWQAGRVQGSTHLAASANRNRLQGDAYAVQHNPLYDNQPTGSFYGFQQLGLTADGSLSYQRTANGNYSQAVLGNGIPTRLLSLSQQLRLGRLGFDAQLDGMFGYQVLNYQLGFLDLPTGFTNNASTVRNRWTPTNQDTRIPAASLTPNTPYAGNNTPVTNQLLENGSNLRLSSLTLTYRLRQTPTQDLSIWTGVQNLFVLTAYRGYDPNVSSGGNSPLAAGQDYGAVPVPRTWLLGVRATL